MLGFWASVVREGRSKPLAILDFFTLGRPVTLQDCFEFMIEHELFREAELQDALAYLQDGSPRRPSKAVARVIEVIERFKSEG